MIYQTFNSGDIVAGRTQKVSSGFFSDGNYLVNQASFGLNSAQTGAFGNSSYDVQSGLYYWNVYYTSQVHFSISYGSLSGNGSPSSDANTNIYPTKANYQTYLNLLLDPSQTAFSFVTGSYNTNSTSTLAFNTVSGSSIFILNFETNLVKSQINPGQISFALNGKNGNTYTFIDDSSVINKESNVYNIISGAIDPVTGIPTPYQINNYVQYQSIGLFYPKNGIIILNADAVDSLLGGLQNGQDSAGNMNVSYTNSYGDSTNFALFQSCLYNSLYAAGNVGANMYALKSEFVPTTQYYVRVQNANFNYTNNPTFVSNGNDGTGLTKGTIKIPELRNNPTTYITTVGLYDANNELIAVAKLSQPVPKSFDNEYLIKVNLAY
jgi:hypothetical protein